MKALARHILTNREKLILKLAARGCSSRQIADKLFISAETVKKHMQNSYRKLGANNKLQALKKAGII